MTIEEAKLRYPKDEEYMNPYISNLQLYIHLPEVERKYLWQETILEMKKFKSNIEQKLNKTNDQIQFDYFGRYYTEVSELITTLESNETKWEYVYWMFNKGKFRTEEEIQDRKDVFTYTSNGFQKKMQKRSNILIAAILLGGTAWLWMVVLYAFLVDPFALPAIFLTAWAGPVLVPAGIIIFSLIADSYLQSDKEATRLEKKFGNSNNFGLATAMVTGVALARHMTKTASKGWINK